MRASRITPSIAVTIGRGRRIYHAFVTTAPTRDAPATVTLHTSSFSDVSAMAARFGRDRNGLTPGRCAACKNPSCTRERHRCPACRQCGGVWDGGANAMARRISCAVRMQHLTGAEARQDDVRETSDGVLPLARCRELLGDEAAGVSDEELDRVRRHADALAHVLIEIAVDRHSQARL